MSDDDDDLNRLAAQIQLRRGDLLDIFVNVDWLLCQAIAFHFNVKEFAEQFSNWIQSVRFEDRLRLIREIIEHHALDAFTDFPAQLDELNRRRAIAAHASLADAVGRNPLDNTPMALSLRLGTRGKPATSEVVSLSDLADGVARAQQARRRAVELCEAVRKSPFRDS